MEGLAGFVTRLVSREASTRSSGLLRIGLALLLWTRFGIEMAPYYSIQPERLLLCASFFLSTSMLLVGWRSRLAAVWTGATLVVAVYGLGFAGPATEWRHHHTYLLATAAALLPLTPCGRSLSLDRWLAVRDARRRGVPPPPERGPVWGLTLLALQVSAVYLWSVVDKVTTGFLTGDKLEQALVYLYLGFRPDPSWWHASMVGLSWVTVALELVLPVGLFVRRLQPVLVPLGLVLHGLFFLVLQVSTFSATVMLLYLAYLDPDDVHRVTDDLLAS